jgi:integrase
MRKNKATEGFRSINLFFGHVRDHTLSIRVVSKPPSARRALKSTVGAERRKARVLKSSPKARHYSLSITAYRRRFRPSLLAHCTGMRAGEIRALQLGDNHADDNAPSICHQIEHGCQVNLPRWRRQRRPCESVGASVPTLPRTGSDE